MGPPANGLRPIGLVASVPGARSLPDLPMDYRDNPPLDGAGGEAVTGAAEDAGGRVGDRKCLPEPAWTASHRAAV